MSHYTKDNPPKVTRNGVTVELRPQKFGKTSPNKGQEFWAMECNALNRSSVHTYVGEEVVDNILTRFLRRVGIDIFTDEKNKTNGVIDWTAVLSDWVDFDTGSATLKDLMEQMSELQDQALEISDIMEDEELVDDDLKVKLECQERYNELTSQLDELTKKIRPIKKQIKLIQEKYAKIAAKRQANKAPVASQVEKPVVA